MDTVIIAGGNAIPSNSATNYAHVQANPDTFGSIEANQRNVVAVAGTFSKLYVQLDTAIATGSFTFSILKNGIASGIICTVSSGTTGSDLSNTFSVVASDTITFKSVPASTPTAQSASFRWTLIFTATTSGESMVMGSTGTTNSTLNKFYQLQGCNTGNATEALAQIVMPTPGTFSNMYVDTNQSPGIGSTINITLVKNGTPSTLVAALTGNNTAASDTTHSVSVVAGDLISIQETELVSPLNGRTRWSLKWVPTTNGESIQTMGNPTDATSTLAYHNSVGGVNAFTATQSQTYSLIQTCTVKKLYVDLVAGPGAAKTRSYFLQQNGTSGAVTVVLTGAGTGAGISTGNDTSNSVSFTAGDTIDLIDTVTALATLSSGSHFGYVTYISPGGTNWTQTVSNSQASSFAITTNNIFIRTIAFTVPSSFSISHAATFLRTIAFTVPSDFSIVTSLNGAINWTQLINNTFTSNFCLLYRFGYSQYTSPADSFTAQAASAVTYVTYIAATDSFTLSSQNSATYTVQTPTPTWWKNSNEEC